MKFNFKISFTIIMLSLSACGGSDKNSTPVTADAALQHQADVAKATLQEKADALARQASMSPPPPAEKKK